MTDVLDGPNDSREMPQEGYQQLSPRSSEKNTVGIIRDPPGRQLNRAIEVARKIAAAAPLGIRATLGSAHRALTDREEAAFAALLPNWASSHRAKITENISERSGKDALPFTVAAECGV